MVAKAASISRLVLALRTWICSLLREQPLPRFSGFLCGVLRLIPDRDPPSAAVVIDVKTITADSLHNFA
jgi:hypothetical protein